MTGFSTQIIGILGAAAVALAGLLSAGSGADRDDRTALVVDVALARDGRELVDTRLRDAADELRVPRTATEARTDVRYLLATGHRLVVAGPRAGAAASGTAAERSGGVAEALAAVRR